MKIPLTNAVADIEAPRQEMDARFRKKDDKRRIGPARYLIDGNDDTAWSTDLGPGRRCMIRRCVMKFATNGWESADGTFLKVWLKYRHGGEDGHGRDNNFLGRFRLAITTAEDPHADPLPAAAVREALAVAKEAHGETTATDFRGVAEIRAGAEGDQRSDGRAVEGLSRGESVLNLARRDPEWHRRTTIYDRGNWQKPKESGTGRAGVFACAAEGRTRGSLDVRAVAGGPALADDRAWR